MRIGNAATATARPCRNGHDALNAATLLGYCATLRSNAATRPPPPRSRPPSQAATPPPPYSPAQLPPPPYAPMDPGPCRAHTGGFPLRVTNWDLELQCNNLDNISKDWE